MRLFIAQGASRCFDFTAYGETYGEAMANLFEAFEIHARQYGLPDDWHTKAVNYDVRELDTNAVYRDGEQLNKGE